MDSSLSTYQQLPSTPGPRQSLATLWRSLRVLFFIGAFLSYLFTSKRNPSADSNLVSSYYGPGAVLAWLFTLITTLITCEGAPVPFRHWMRVGKQSKKDELATGDPKIDQPSIDGALLSIIAYPTISAVDCLLRQRSRERDNAPNTEPDAQLEASIAIAKFLFASLCLLGVLGSSALQSVSSTRKVAWVIPVFLNAFVLLYTRPFGDIPRYIAGTLVLVIYAGRNFLESSLGLWKRASQKFPPNSIFSEEKSRRAHEMLAWVVAKLKEWTPTNQLDFIWLVYCGLLGYLSAIDAVRSDRVLDTTSGQMIFRPGFSFKPLFPQTSSGLSDLDQAAAFGTAMVAFSYPFLRGLLQNVDILD
jgi:hypothetical protein